MSFLAIPFPPIDPIAIEIGPFAIRWYALAYIGGLLFAWWYMARLAATDRLWGDRSPITRDDAGDIIVWGTVGVVLGGRLGYVLFYHPGYFMQNPAEILVIWQGGMSFHGGFLGVVAAVLLYARYRGRPVSALSDVAAAAAPFGLMLGRIANFINQELWGRPTDLPWGVIFPLAGPDPRHPSQLYQAALEGALLFLLLWILIYRFAALRRPWLATGTFLAGYGAARIVGEAFRMPDAYIGFLWGGLTMGMALSLPMLALGIAVITWAMQKGPQNRGGK
jgi:phosphatidylglycerol---prolipoprotein diacylglyceryl transferase